MSKPPLWRVMCRAMAEVEMGARATAICAAEIRALRDWLVPEERPCPDMPIEALLRDDRQRLRTLLTAEADRAERGEVEHG